MLNKNIKFLNISWVWKGQKEFLASLGASVILEVFPKNLMLLSQGYGQKIFLGGFLRILLILIISQVLI